MRRNQMKIYITFTACLSLLLIPFSVSADKGNPSNSIESRYSYTMGYRIGQMLKAQGMKTLDDKNFMQGLEDQFAGKKPWLDEIEMNDAVTSYQQHVKQQRKNNPRLALEYGTEFLAKNRSNPGVVEMPSGLQYIVLKPAEGAQPKSSDTVQVHYHGTLIDGEVFDSSIDRGSPTEFALNRVIQGFSEALTNMHVGEKWRIFVPPSLGYGKRGAGGVIGPNATLIFEIELLAIK